MVRTGLVLALSLLIAPGVRSGAGQVMAFSTFDSIGSWEELEDAFRTNFQGTYVRPPDADDLSDITQQPEESARKL